MARKKIIQIDNSNKDDSPINWDEAPFMRHSYYRTEKEVRDLCEEMLVAIETDEHILSIEELLSKKRISDVTYYRWVAKYPAVKQAHEFFLRALGYKREKYASFGKCPVNSQMPYLWMYLDRYAKHDERAAQLKAQNPDTPSNITVVIPPFKGDHDNKA